MNTAKTICCGMVLGLGIVAASSAHADVVNYTLENVILDSNNAQMFGTFSWTYDVGDFENGVGQFTFLDIPFTSHDHTDLNTTIDIGSSIEITLPGSVHDDGVDITLFLLQPLTPDTGSDIDLAQSRYEIGGNGFHTGLFLSGSVVPAGVTDVEDPSVSPGMDVAAPGSKLTNYPNPFNPRTNIVFELDQPSTVRLEVLDLRGRLVRSMAEGILATGTHSVTWDGKDSQGRSVPSGRYLARLETGDDVVTRSMTLVR